MSVNHPIGVRSPYDSLAPVHREQLPAVVLRLPPESVDASRTRQKKICISDTLNQQCLKPLPRDLEEPLTSTVIDLDYFRSAFLFPLDYLRGTLIAAYEWAQQLLSMQEDRVSPNVDLYV
jgi:hypothetical protein